MRIDHKIRPKTQSIKWKKDEREDNRTQNYIYKKYENTFSIFHFYQITNIDRGFIKKQNSVIEMNLTMSNSTVSNTYTHVHKVDFNIQHNFESSQNTENKLCP